MLFFFGHTSKEKALKIVSILIWLLLGCGCSFAVYHEIKYYTEFTRVILLLYLAAFGALGLVFEFRVPLLVRSFPFLDTFVGRGLFFAFCSSLCLSFGFASSPVGRLLPAIVGIICAMFAFVLLIASCCISTKKEPSAPNLPNPPPPVIANQGPREQPQGPNPYLEIDLEAQYYNKNYEDDKV